jgi:hypothetical protein
LRQCRVPRGRNVWLGVVQTKQGICFASNNVGKIGCPLFRVE